MSGKQTAECAENPIIRRARAVKNWVAPEKGPLGISWGDRFKYAPWTVTRLVLGVALSLTPLGWITPAKRWIFDGLANSPTFAPRSSASFPRPLALHAWDLVHPQTTFVAAALFTIGVPVVAWFLLGLSDVWAGSTVDASDPDKVLKDLQNKVLVVQLIVGLILGAVAIQAFLLFQLPSARPPNVSIRVLTPSTMAGVSGNGFRYSARSAKHIKVESGGAVWIHVRVTNVGVRSYDRISVGAEVPFETQVGRAWTMLEGEGIRARVWEKSEGHFIEISSESQGEMPDDARPYEYRRQYRTVEFETNQNPRETGPGDSGLYPFHLGLPGKSGEYTIKIVVRSSDSSGATSQKIRVTVS